MRRPQTRERARSWCVGGSCAGGNSNGHAFAKRARSWSCTPGGVAPDVSPATSALTAQPRPRQQAVQVHAIDPGRARSRADVVAVDQQQLLEVAALDVA